MNGYVTTSEAGDLLGVSASRVRQFILEGRLPAKKIGNLTLMISVRSIARFRAKRAKGSRQSRKSNGNGK